MRDGRVEATVSGDAARAWLDDAARSAAPTPTPPQPEQRAAVRRPHKRTGPQPVVTDTIVAVEGDTAEIQRHGLPGLVVQSGHLQHDHAPQGSYLRSDGVLLVPAPQTPGTTPPAVTPRIARAAAARFFFDRLPQLAAIADDPTQKPVYRLRAIELLAQYGLGTATAKLDDSGAAQTGKRSVRVRFDSTTGERQVELIEERDTTDDDTQEGQDDALPPYLKRLAAVEAADQSGSQ